jgi:hypothetical protein
MSRGKECVDVFFGVVFTSVDRQPKTNPQDKEGKDGPFYRRGTSANRIWRIGMRSREASHYALGCGVKCGHSPTLEQ